MALKVDWNAMRAEYISTNRGYRKLSEKYNVSISTIQKQANRGCWLEARNEFKATMHDKVITKVMDKQVKEIADDLLKELACVDALSQVLVSLLQGDEQQFFRHLINMEHAEDSEKDKWTEEKIFRKADMKAFRDAVAALKDLVQIKKSLLGIIDPLDQENLEIARERLELDRQKVNGPDDDENETGVVALDDVIEIDEDNIVEVTS